MAPVSVVAVRDRSELRRFVDLPYRLHHEAGAWVPPLRSDVLACLVPRRNPFFERARVQSFVAWRGGAVVGRVTAQVVDGRALWGFFECDEGSEVAGALLDAAGSWLVEQGITAAEMVGPASFTAWEQAGVLVEGFETSPAYPRAWQPPRYRGLVEAAGCEPDGELLTHRFELPGREGEAPAASLRAGSLRAGSLRAGSLRAAERAVTAAAGRLDAAVRGESTAVAPTEAEARARFRRLRPCLDARLAVLDGDDVAVGLPDLHEILTGLARRIGPIGSARLLARARRGSRGASAAFLSAGSGVLGSLLEAAGRAGYEHLDVTASARFALPPGSRVVHRWVTYRRPL